MTANPETDPTAYVEVLARLLCAADVHVHGDEHPTWQHLVGETGSRIRDDYRAAARWLAARLTVAPAVAPSPPATDRATLLAELITNAEEWDGHITVQELRRMAAEARPADGYQLDDEYGIDVDEDGRPFARVLFAFQPSVPGGKRIALVHGITEAVDGARFGAEADEAQQQPEGECPQCGDAGACAGGRCPLLPAVGARQPDTETQDSLPDRLEAALTERFTSQGNPFSEMRRHEQGPDGWPASHPVGPAEVAEVLRELLDAAAGGAGGVADETGEGEATS